MGGIFVIFFINLLWAEQKQANKFSLSINEPYQKQNTNLVQIKHKRALKISSFNTLLPIATGLAIIFNANENGSIKKAGTILIGYGVLLGPSTGHIYLNNPGRAITGFLMRSFGALVIYGAAVAARLSGLCEYNCPSDEEIERRFWSMTAISTAFITWSMVQGFLSLKKSARELYKKEHRIGLYLKYDKNMSFQVGLSYSFL